MSHTHETDMFGDRIPEERFVTECHDPECEDPDTLPVTVHDIGGWGEFDTLRESLLPRIFGHMVRLAEGVVEEFHGDLFHDAEWLRKNVDGPCEFEFMVRTSGTNLGESARIMANIGAPGAIRYRLTIAHNERMSWSLTVEEI